VKRDTISKFNRDTVWLATGLLGTVFFAALVLALQECQPKATQAESSRLLNANPARAESVLASSSSNGKMTPGRGSGDDHTCTETSLLEIPDSETEPAAPTPARPEIKHNAPRQDPAREKRLRIRNGKNRSSVGFGTADVKRRLIELWHESLARSGKSRSWTAFSNLNSGASKKAAYTAETSH
jgi:hypothetical protein